MSKKRKDQFTGAIGYLIISSGRLQRLKFKSDDLSGIYRRFGILVDAKESKKEATFFKTYSRAYTAVRRTIRYYEGHTMFAPKFKEFEIIPVFKQYHHAS